MPSHITKWNVVASHRTIMTSYNFSRKERWMSWKALDSHKTNMIVCYEFSCYIDESIAIFHRITSFRKWYDELVTGSGVSERFWILTE